MFFLAKRSTPLAKAKVAAAATILMKVALRSRLTALSRPPGAKPCTSNSYPPIRRADGVVRRLILSTSGRIEDFQCESYRTGHAPFYP
jgi:hypothetical protein